MSNSCLIRWFEALLFGSSSDPPPPPREVKDLILRMEVENIAWPHIMVQGGLTAFPYQVHGDLNSLIDYLERQWLEETPPHEPTPFKTRAVAKFWHELSSLITKRDEQKRCFALPEPSAKDDDILKVMLEGGTGGFPASPHHSLHHPLHHPPLAAYQSAAFWGEVARRFVNLHRDLHRDLPRAGTVSPTLLPNGSDDPAKRVLELYDMTCQSRGQRFDPLSLHLVHHSEYLNAAHWQTPQNLEAFMRDRPSHPLALSVQSLLKRSVEDVLQGEKPSAYLHPCPRLDALLHNIRVIHESVEQVPHEDTPPRLIDTFQRLLALSYRDGLWEKVVPVLDPAPSLVGTSLFYLTEQLRIAEREKRVLWKHVTMERDSESAAKTPQRTCADYLYDRGRPGPSRGEWARPTPSLR